MPEDELRQVITEQLLVHRPVRLRSGESSDYYINIKRGYGEPGLLHSFARALGERLGPDVTCLAATGVGGIPLATAMSLTCGLPLVVVRESSKDHGIRKQFEGYQPAGNDRVAIVDDVFTTGSSLRTVMESLTSSEVAIEGCYVLVARGTTDLPVPVTSVFSASDIGL